MKRKIRFFIVVLCIAALSLSHGFGAKVWAANKTQQQNKSDDDKLFSGETIVSPSKVLNNNADAKLKQSRIGLTGEIEAYFKQDEYFKEYELLPSLEDQTLESKKIHGDLFLDMRLKNGFRTYVAVEPGYDFEKEKQEWSTKEFFFDTIVKRKMYIRTGKQVLVWGRSYFWNPTDLINVEKKDFLDMDAVREGTYGIKIQVPSGVRRNNYLFINMDDAVKKGKKAEASDVSVAAKYEFLLKNTEMSFSAWGKQGFRPVFGYDYSGRIMHTDVYGEISSSPGYRKVMDYDTLARSDEDGGWNPQASVGFTKYFNSGRVSRRICITSEFYYNANGYERNIYQRIKEEIDATDFDDPTSVENLKQKITDYLGNIYEPYRNSKYYAALFGSYSQFCFKPVTLNINCLVNLVDNSGILVAGFDLTPKRGHYSIYFNANRKFGDKYTEATIYGNLMSFTAGAKITF